MYITTLPVPGMHFQCSPKAFLCTVMPWAWFPVLNLYLKRLFGNWEAPMRRIMKLIAGGGLSITDSHTMCGDYLYNGHIVILTLTISLSKSVMGIFCILQAHDHYTVDVVALKETSQSNLFSRVWWYRQFQYFEENVKGIVPRNYQLPWSSWRSSSWSRWMKYSRLDTQ
ncbi:unnamed protein product [Coregonus sp. 'balchen']|nr:unnamed protein product [Coregonus sp. 'balchen']